MKYRLGNNSFIWSKSIDDEGYLNDMYGAKSNPNNTQFNSFSPEFCWKKVDNCKSYALTIIDADATKVIGFPFIHWVVLNIKENYIKENESYNSFLKWDKSSYYNDEIIWQGFNSSVPKTKLVNNKEEGSKLQGILPMGFTNNDLNNAILYFGPYPPNEDHIYTLELYALSEEAKNLKTLNNNLYEKLNKPYYLDDFYKAINNNVIEKYILNFKYKKVG